MAAPASPGGRSQQPRPIPEDATPEERAWLRGYYAATRQHTQFPRNFFKRLNGKVHHSAIVFAARLIEETGGHPRKTGTAPPRFWEASYTDLADEFGMTESGLRKAVKELQECITREDLDQPLGVVDVQPREGDARLLQFSFNFQALPELETAPPIIKPKKLATKEERLERARAAEEAAEAKRRAVAAVCPIGLECPVKEAVLDGEPGREIVRFIAPASDLVLYPAESVPIGSLPVPSAGEPTSEDGEVNEEIVDKQALIEKISYSSARSPRPPAPKNALDHALLHVRKVAEQALKHPIDLVIAEKVLAELHIDENTRPAHRAALIRYFGQACLGRRAEIRSDAFLEYIARDCMRNREAELAQARAMIPTHLGRPIPGATREQYSLGAQGNALMLVEVFPELFDEIEAQYPGLIPRGRNGPLN